MAGAVRIRKRSSASRQRPFTTCGVTETDVTEPTDLNLLKEVSQRLNLATRRPSTVQWKKVIEFRKSMGLYSSDVEPDFLDKIVEAKMRCSANNSPSTRPRKNRVHRVKKSEESSHDVDGKKRSKTTESKCSKMSKRSEAKMVKHGLSLIGNDHQKTAKEELKTEYSKFSKTAEKTNLTTAELSEDDTVFDESPATSPFDVTAKEWGKSAGERVGRFSLYDTEDEDDVAAGMTETEKRHRNITRALGKIRRDLIIMRMADNSLARKLLDARSKINLIRVRQSCDAHAEMLDDLTYELEEEDLLPGLIKACDLPSRPPGSLLSAFASLRDIGVSRMNINRRRFSVK